MKLSIVQKILHEIVAAPKKDSKLIVRDNDVKVVSDSANQKGDIDINSHFKLIFIAILIMTGFFAIATFYITVAIAAPTPMQEDLYHNLVTLTFTGFGTLCGLIGGKSV
jgi:hypothetical protein